MKLATVTDVSGTLQFDSMTNLDSAIEAALHLATEQLTSVLMASSLARETRTDIFMLTDTIRLQPELHYARCALSRGLLAGQPTVVWASTLGGLDDDPETLTSAFWKCNLTKGELVLHVGSDLVEKYLAVTYTCGLEAGTGEEADLYQDVPDWLQIAARQYAIVNLMESNPELRGGQDEGAPRRSPRYLRAAAEDIVASNIRYFASANRPLI